MHDACNVVHVAHVVHIVHVVHDMLCMVCTAFCAERGGGRRGEGGERDGAGERALCLFVFFCLRYICVCAFHTHTHTHTHTATQNAPHTRQTHHIVPASPLRKFLPRSRNLQRLRLSLSMRPGICLIIAALTLRMNSGRVVSCLHCVQCTERRRSRFGIPMGICAALLWGRCLLACALFLGVAVGIFGCVIISGQRYLCMWGGADWLVGVRACGCVSAWVGVGGGRRALALACSFLGLLPYSPSQPSLSLTRAFFPPPSSSRTLLRTPL